MNKQRLGEMRRMAQSGVETSDGWGRDYHRGYLACLDDVERGTRQDTDDAMDRQLGMLESVVQRCLVDGTVPTKELREWIDQTRQLLGEQQ